MKKVLSAIIAIIMIVSCMPFASAHYDEMSTVAMEFYEAFSNHYGIMGSVYTKDGATGVTGYSFVDGTKEEVEYAESIFKKFDQINPFFNDNGIKYLSENEPEKVIEITDGFKKINEILDKNIVESGYTKVLDASLYMFLDDPITLYLCYYNKDYYESYVNFLSEIGDDLTNELREHQVKINDMYQNAKKDINSVTQEEFDAEAEIILDFHMNALDCFEGVHIPGEFTDLGDGTHKADCTFCKSGEVIEAHTYGEYTPNGDATTEADGTKTAKCEKCDATDTVADEGSKLVEDIAESNFFNDIIEKIMSFFENIINFFKNLIG